MKGVRMCAWLDGGGYGGLTGWLGTPPAVSPWSREGRILQGNARGGEEGRVAWQRRQAEEEGRALEGGVSRLHLRRQSENISLCFRLPKPGGLQLDLGHPAAFVERGLSQTLTPLPDYNTFKI